jgi:hypothetical protein
MKPRTRTWAERQAKSSMSQLRESLNRTVLLHNYFFYGRPNNEAKKPHTARDDTSRGGGAGQAH